MQKRKNKVILLNNKKSKGMVFCGEHSQLQQNNPPPYKKKVFCRRVKNDITGPKNNIIWIIYHARDEI